MKYGDAYEQALYLESDSGIPLSFSTAALFLASGGALSWEAMDGTAVSPQPSYTLAADDVLGRHELLFNLPTVASNLKVTMPTGFRCDPIEIPLLFASADETTIVNLLTSAIGTPAAQDRITIYDWTTTENDSFFKEMTFPVTAMTDWGYTDFTASGWTITGAVRTVGDTGTSVPLAVLSCEVTDAADHEVGVGWGVYPTGLALSATDLANGSLRVNYDVQARKTETFAITAVVSGASGKFTVAGDKRKYFSVNTGSTFTIDTGANAGTYTPTGLTLTAGNTVITVATVPDAGVAGNILVPITITGIRGALTLNRQEDRT